jgi:hypothetical protein
MMRTYDELCHDAKSSPIERESALLREYNQTLRENSRLRAVLSDLLIVIEPDNQGQIRLDESWERVHEARKNAKQLLTPNAELTCPSGRGENYE